jgi:hypothetical protein
VNILRNSYGFLILLWVTFVLGGCQSSGMVIESAPASPISDVASQTAGADAASSPAVTSPQITSTASPAARITIREVQVQKGAYVQLRGQSDLPEGACILTRLEQEGEKAAWWPEDSCATVMNGQWQLTVQLGGNGAPQHLDENALYAVGAWYKDDPDIEAVYFPFDLQGPPAASTEIPAAEASRTPLSVVRQETPDKPATAQAALTQVVQRWATATAGSATREAIQAFNSAVPTAIIESVVAVQQPEVHSYSSPDGNWRAEIYRYGCVLVPGQVDQNAYEQLNIVRVSDGFEFQAADQLQNCGGVGAAGLGGLFWSPNSRYFYFTATRSGVPDGCCCNLWVPDMSRVDVAEGIVESTPGFGRRLPDGQTVLIPGTDAFILWDLDEGERSRTSFAVPGTLLASFSLSPQDDALVYLLTEDCWYSPGNSYLVLMDIPRLEQKPLLESGDPTFGSVNWETHDQLTLWDGEARQWVYEISTGNLSLQK